MIKIAIVVHNLIGGGAERVAAIWASGFAMSNYDVHVIIEDWNRDTRKYDIDSRVFVHNQCVPINNGLLSRSFNKILKLLGLRKKNLKRIIESINPDVCIIIGDEPQYGLRIHSILGDSICKIIQTYHNTFDLPEYASIEKKRRIKQRFDQDIYDAITIFMQADIDYIANRLHNVYYLPNPLTFKPIDILPQKEKIILASGRLDVWHCKGFDILIEAWGKIACRYPEWKLLIAGTGQEENLNLLEKMVLDNNVVNQVQFLGFRDDMIDLYKKAEIFVLSSRYEGFGMVLIEAMSQGCACIAANYKGRQSEIIKDESMGLCCPVDDCESLSMSIEKMINDGEYRKKCQKNAIDRSRYYSMENTMIRWNHIFKSIGVLS